jgi:glycine C-acetyltransferase
MQINFNTATFKDFEKIPGFNAVQRASKFGEFLNFMRANDHLNYRLVNVTGCRPETEIITPYSNGQPVNVVSLVSNDYLNLTQHPKVKAASIAAIEEFGTGSGASPLIGGHLSYHHTLEKRIAEFFGRTEDCAVTFTTGYTANSATLLSLLVDGDAAIVDSAVHTSVYEGLKNATTKSFPHNDMEALERNLKFFEGKHDTILIIVDGVYSQDGDIAPLDTVHHLAKKYNALVMVDDAHGIGVLGKTGRGALEDFDLLEKVDIITGTFSKTFGHIGGYVISSPAIVDYLKFQSRQHIFSSTATPASAGILKAIDLIDEEPELRAQLWKNITYLKNGLEGMGLNVGTTCSAIVPVKIGNIALTGDTGKLLLKAGVFANPILYPAVAKNNSRIRMSVMATHTKEHLDKVLNAFDYVNQNLHISI